MEGIHLASISQYNNTSESDPCDTDYMDYSTSEDEGPNTLTDEFNILNDKHGFIDALFLTLAYTMGLSLTLIYESALKVFAYLYKLVLAYVSSLRSASRYFSKSLVLGIIRNTLESILNPIRKIISYINNKVIIDENGMGSSIFNTLLSLVLLAASTSLSFGSIMTLLELHTYSGNLITAFANTFILIVMFMCAVCFFVLFSFFTSDLLAKIIK